MTPEEQAYEQAIAGAVASAEPARRLSWLRIGLVLALVALGAGTTVAFQSGAHPQTVTPLSQSFAPYVDVTATPEYAFEDPTVLATNDVVLGFVVSTPGDFCQPSWGGAYSLAAASTGIDLDRRIARVRLRGGQVSVSFGGAANQELSTACTDPASLTAAYTAVVNRYSLNSIDLDIESPAASAPDVDARRAAAIKAVELAQKAAGHPLSVWLTLPINPSGLTSTGLAVLNSMLQAHVAISGVNAMTMDFDLPLPSDEDMASASEDALTTLQRQLLDAYKRVGVTLTSDQAWRQVAATPMIGQNDVPEEIFDLTNAASLLDFARLHHLPRLSMWSANRDQACGPNYANVQVVSDNCSGVLEATGAFSALFSSLTTPPPAGRNTNARTGLASPGGAAATAAASATAEPSDNPATSPYPIWNATAAYAKNTKIVWHHNVYEAKWWTQGDIPDAPVADQDDTPWTLIGPVLPGEHPAPLPTLSSGTYPNWSATQIYVAGDRVLLNGVGYQAKWWTQGDRPLPNPLQPSDTPWELISGLSSS